MTKLIDDALDVLYELREVLDEDAPGDVVFLPDYLDKVTVHNAISTLLNADTKARNRRNRAAREKLQWELNDELRNTDRH